MISELRRFRRPRPTSPMYHAHSRAREPDYHTTMDTPDHGETRSPPPMRRSRSPVRRPRAPAQVANPGPKPTATSALPGKPYLHQPPPPLEVPGPRCPTPDFLKPRLERLVQVTTPAVPAAPSSQRTAASSAQRKRSSSLASRSSGDDDDNDDVSVHSGEASRTSSPTAPLDEFLRPAGAAAPENDIEGLIPFACRVELIRETFKDLPEILNNPAKSHPPRNPVGVGVLVPTAEALPSLPFAPTRLELFKLEQAHLEGIAKARSSKSSGNHERMGTGKFPRRPHFNASYQTTDQPVRSTATVPPSFRSLQKHPKEKVSYSLQPADVLDLERRIRQMTSISSLLDWVLGACLVLIRGLIDVQPAGAADTLQQVHSLLNSASKACSHTQQAQVSLLSAAVLRRRDAFLATMDSDVSATTKTDLRCHDLASESLFAADTCEKAKTEIAEAAQTRLNESVKMQSRASTSTAVPWKNDVSDTEHVLRKIQKTYLHLHEQNQWKLN